MSSSRASRVQLLLVLAAAPGAALLRAAPALGRAGEPRLPVRSASCSSPCGAVPGPRAVAGFLVGLIADALTPARFGAGALAHTVVGYLASWGRAVFFADNMLVNAGFVAVGLWLRDLIVLLASGGGSPPAPDRADALQPAPGAHHGAASR